ncbi:ABC transporter substrate-binding protein [Nocardioides sp.]|uniref:ABC transporter substrate-binding protein n=1 Tax=Nocardioides sp. TaxID=35761 RepID=UPI0039E5BE18
MTAYRNTARWRRGLALPVLAVTTSLVITACGGSSSDDEASGSNDDSSSSSTGSDSAFSVNVDDCEDPEAATETIEGTLKIGYSAPLSGPVAGVVEEALIGFRAGLKAINDAGGINGVKVEAIYKDDQFAPDKAKANGTEFIEKEDVDTLDTFGAGALSGMVDDQNAACVPMLYPSSSDPQYSDIETYPWTVQYLPSAAVETKFLVKYLQSKVSDPTIGIVENAAASGKAAAEAFKAAAEDAGLTIVKEVEDTDPAAAATTMKEAGVNVIYHAGVVGTCGAFDTARERIDYHPDLELKASNCVSAEEYIAAGPGADGVTLAKYLKDTGDATYANDEDVKEYVAAIGSDGDPNDTITQSGWMVAMLLKTTLQQAADSDEGLTRKSIIEAARDQDYAAPLLMPGINWVSSATRPAGVSGFQAVSWDADQQKFVADGDVISVD